MAGSMAVVGGLHGSRGKLASRLEAHMEVYMKV